MYKLDMSIYLQAWLIDSLLFCQYGEAVTDEVFNFALYSYTDIKGRRMLKDNIHLLSKQERKGYIVSN